MVITDISKIPKIKGFYYLAAQYGHPDPKVVKERMDNYEYIDGFLMAEGLWTFSPLDKHYKLGYANLPGTYDYWKGYCEAMMNLAAGLIVIVGEEMDKSPGVQDEIRMARERGIPIYYV